MKKLIFGIALTMLLASCSGNPSVAPSEKASETPTPSEAASEPASEAASETPSPSVFVAPENAYKVTFTKDDNIEKILIFADQDYTVDPFECEEPMTTYSRNDADGSYTKYVEGVADPDTQEIVGEIKPQVNFKVVCKDGYEPDTPTFEGEAKNVKDQTNGIFRVTVIKGDITIHCTSKAVGTQEDVTDALEVAFICSHCSVTVWKTENTGDHPAAILDDAERHYARNKTSGALANDGSGQIYFKVTCDEGYEFAPSWIADGETTSADFVAGTYNKMKYADGIYNITKIASALTITLTAVAA